MFWTKAAFFHARLNVWAWHAWFHNQGNKHAAILTKQTELSADGADFGNADHYESDRIPGGRR